MDWTAPDAALRAEAKAYDLLEIASPRFVRLVNLAHVEGYLAPILAGQSEELRERVFRSRDFLLTEVRQRFGRVPLEFCTPHPWGQAPRQREPSDKVCP